MRRKKFLGYFIGVIVIILSALIGTLLHPQSSHELIVATISLAVAFLALLIGSFTYFSIDEVNAISHMDGNVMENPRYHPNLLKYFLQFQQVSLEDTSKMLIEYMEKLFSHNIKSGAHLADNVQEVADMLVLVPFLIKSNEKQVSAIQEKRVVSLITKIKSRVNDFASISDGSCKLLNETVNLIDAVFAYQTMEHADGKESFKLLEIRGSLFINPATRVLYYDYLGLYFLRRASSIISNQEKKLSIKDKIERVRNSSREDLSMAKVYAVKASEAFKEAKENAGSDMMWGACASFNIARAEYMIKQINTALGEGRNNSWEEYANESIRGWITLNKIIAEHLANNEQVSLLQQALISQENKMHLIKIIYQMMDNENLTDYNGKNWIDKENYASLIDTTLFQRIPKEDPQARTDLLKAEITQMLLE